MRIIGSSSIAAVVWVGILTPWPAAAQFLNFTTTEDGSILYFSSPNRQDGSGQTFHYKIFRWDAAGGFRVFAEVQSEGQPVILGCVNDSFYQLQAPQVSDDGTVLAYTATRPGPQSRLCDPVETNQGVVKVPGREVRLDGAIDLSPNGRYAVTTTLEAFTNNFHIVTDLSSGTSSVIAGSFDRSGRVTDGATVVMAEPTAVIVTDRNGATRVVQTRYEVNHVIIDRSGKTLIYVTNSSQLGFAAVPIQMSSLDLATGRETVLTTRSLPANPILTSDGATVFFIGSSDETLPDRQLYAIGVDGQGLRQITNETAPVQSAAVSGDGRVAYVLTLSRLVRIDVTSGKSTGLSPAPPFLGQGPEFAQLGNFISFDGGVNDVQQLTLCGQPVLFTVIQQPGTVFRPQFMSVQFQVPWDAPVGTCQVVIENDSAFDHGVSLEVTKSNPIFVSVNHIAGPITQAAPAHPGEVIVIYMTGLGPADRDQLLTPGFACRFDGVPGALTYAGPAPGFVNFYQINVTVPNLTPRSANLSCGWDATPPFADTSSAVTSIWIG
jgi:uncharacterized protein (TIGR03437 family)